MIYQEQLRDLTESYLKSLVAEASDSLNPDFDSSAPFGELGINSFYVLKIIKKLEAEFGTLSKSLLFENFTIDDLTAYFVGEHEQTLSAKFAEQLQGANFGADTNGHRINPVQTQAKPAVAIREKTVAREATPIRILEKDAYVHPEFGELLQSLFSRYKIEGCVSRGTRMIAPNLFIGSARRGYFNYGRCKNIILVYAYTGPRDYFSALMEEMHQYCETNQFELNTLADEEMQPIGGKAFTATPFGALQRISHLKEFALEGGEMRRLRHQVSKFQKTGACKTQEYQCGSNAETDQNIASVIDQWCQAKTMVNPLVHQARGEILAGALDPAHRLFLTYLDDLLQNVILITPMSAEVNGYLMDLEFYLPDMPRGGLEFGIVQIIKVLVAEGCDVLSLGGTYGCKLNSSPQADAGIDRILDDLRVQNIFNDEGNLQFKNKFRPDNKPLYLCRPVGSGSPDNVIDVIMMIADPVKVQTSEAENHNFDKTPKDSPASIAKSVPRRSTSLRATEAVGSGPFIDRDERWRILSEFGFNPLNIPHEYVEFDLKTDSWAQLEMPAVEAQMRHLHAQLQQPVNVDEVVRGVFPMAHSVLTVSGQAAENIFFKAWPKRGVVLQNLLFPSTIFHQIDKGFAIKELPHPALLLPGSQELYRGNMNWEAVQAQVAQDPGAIAFVLIELGNNAAGGYPVSLRHLHDLKTLLAGYSIPLIMDGTRVVENAQFLIEKEKGCQGKTVWTVVQEIFAHADAVIGSLTKDFCVNKGGIVATNDVRLFQRLQELVHEEGAGIDLIDKKMIALSLLNRKQIEARVLRRMEGVRQAWRAFKERSVPVLEPAGGHCVVIDVKRIPEFRDFDYPAASFVAWLYWNTGIRAAAHNVGMEKRAQMSDLVRLAVPVGLKRDQIAMAIDRLIHAFENKGSIPEVVIESSKPQLPGSGYANYKLKQAHTDVASLAAKADTTTAAPGKVAATQPPASQTSPASPRLKQKSGPMEAPANGAPKTTGESLVNRKSRPAQDIAIVGMAGRYPKAKDLGELWQNLTQGKNCIEDIPASRYQRRLQHGSAEKYRGGFIDDVDKFDSLFFSISPREAEMLDPQERLFLEVAWEAIEDAGYYPEILAREDGSRNVGVFVGAVWAMYQMLGLEEKHAGNKIVPNSFLWSIANRVSYWMNLSGPSLTLDTACSSSLTAIYLACEAIRSGECSAAIVGGVNLDLHQTKLDINQAGGALSSDGVCRSFGKNANGYVAGEGVGALFLKPLDQAVRDCDQVYGVIKSAVVNHGGRTSGYTVPNPKAQTNLIASAFEKAGIGAESIGYIEAHGTGTELGDPLEIAGLSQAFRADRVVNQSCAIGSIKSNIGHLEAAAGVVGISKVLLQMKHRQLAPSLHSSELNEFIDFTCSPFYVVQRLQEWKGKELDGVRLPLRAGISSFGAGGSNAHIILENYEPIEKSKDEPAQPGERIFPLSARSEDQLRDTASRLAQFLQQNPIDLEDVAYTLQIGRKSFEHRMAVIARTKEELCERLICFVEGKNAEAVTSGHVKSAEAITRLLNRREKEEFIRLLSEGRDPRRIATLWAEGLLTDWQGVKSHSAGKRVSLPTYPFADKRHWASKNSSIGHSSHPAEGIHPLVDTNESTFDRQLFKKTFHDRDFFIYDHRVGDVPTLPGVAYLELARKAGEIAAGRRVQKIRNILWVSPIAVQDSVPKEVFIELKPNQAAVRFEVFSNDDKGNKVLHSQGSLLYTTQQEATAGPEYIDLESIRARCAKVIDGKDAYPLFKAFGLNLGPSFQVLQEVYKNENETLGVLKLPEFRQEELQSMVLHPSLVDGSLQAGMGAQLGEKVGEMFVPFSIGEVEILHPLPSNCFSYVTEVKEDKKGKRENTRILKSNVYIVDETGKVLIKIRESVGVPLRELHDKPAQKADVDGFSKLYYAYEWEKAPLAAENEAKESPHSLLLFDTEETLRDLYLERLGKAGTNSDQIILVRPGEAFEDLGGQCYKINPQRREDFTQLFEVLMAKGWRVENICFAWSSAHTDFRDEKCLKESLERGVGSFLFVCQALVKQKIESTVQLLYLYSGTQDEAQPHNDAMRGFINSLHLEHPKLLCKTLEVRQENVRCDQILDAVSVELHARIQDATAVRYQDGDRSIKRLKAFDLPQAAGSAASQGMGIREKGVFLITGGVGGLGLIFADFLVRRFKARLVLTGRSKLSEAQEAKLEALRTLGGEVLYLRADISNYEAAANLVKESKSHYGEINGIIHAAGVLRDSLIRNKTAEEMSAVFAPKIYGMLHLDELTKNEELDFFIAFSSLAAVAGNGGQCDYSFANHFMDSLAAERERLRAKGARSGRTLSINWSLWAEGGMKLDQQTELYFKKTLGIKPLATQAGLEAMVDGLASDRPQFVVLEGVQEKVEVAWGLKKKKAAATLPASFDQGVTSALVPEQKGGDYLARLQKELSQMVVEFLKLDASEMSADKVLLDLGFDSIGLTTFANAINEKYLLDLTPVLFFDYPSVGEIAKYLSEERQSEISRFFGGSATAAGIVPAAPTARQQAETQPGAKSSKGWNPAGLDGEAAPLSSGQDYSPERRFLNTPIAIVGMSGVMPQSADLDEYWENLKNSKDMTTVIPADRWRWEDYYGDPLKEANKSNSKWGGFMKEIDKFDPMFFSISPREAQVMDPQQRIFLEHVWKAIEDSGHKVSDLSGTRTGLFVGVATNDYIDVMNSGQSVLDGYTASGNSHSVLANRVSFLLNLRGPSAPIDTACSSSLVALHRAIESIHTGSSDMAIVGGVQVMMSPAAYISFAMAGMLSGDGKCKTFDKRANGYVRGEGAGAIFIKPLSVAEADGDHIYAVIRATAENHGGRVTTLTAPNSAAQSSLLVEAYEKAHMDPTTVGYIECHGTGTSLGDPIEIQGLSKAFAELYKRHNKLPATTPHCGLSSVKTNIGHLETAAGIASILKVLLAIKHKQIPANIHFEEINPYISLKGTPFYIADKLTPWEAAKGENGAILPRRAGVSSFGFGGANAHIVLEEYIPAKRSSLLQEPGPQLIVLSAKNEERLKAYVHSMHAYLEQGGVDLIDFAYTLQMGRDEMAERLALVVSSTVELAQKLEQILHGAERPKDSYWNNVRNKVEGTGEEKEALEQRDIPRLAELWVSGVKIDWRLLYNSDVPRRISIPTYPFARERYWIPAAAITATTERQDKGNAVLHPLIHRNVSTLEEQKFASRFTGEEFYFTDHVVEAQKILPGVAYLEIARAAGELSGGSEVRIIRSLTWERPLIAGNDPEDVVISLTPVGNEVKFSVKNSRSENPIVYCTGKLAYSFNTSAPAVLDIAAIQDRCSEQVMSGKDLYPLLASSGLNLGKSFQIVDKIYANPSESLAILKLPEHLARESDQFWLHPSLMDGSLHTAVGLMKKNGLDAPLSIPYSVGEVQIFGSLKDLYYGYATWAVDNPLDNQDNLKVHFELLDKSGKVLVRIRDFASRPVHRSTAKVAPEQEEIKAGLHTLVPLWKTVHLAASKRNLLPESSMVLLLRGDEAQLGWARRSYPNAQLLELDPFCSVDVQARKLGDCKFDQLLWIAPDEDVPAAERIIAQQDEGVMAVFRIIKALLQLGYGNKKLRWTMVTARTQRVNQGELIQPAHAGIAGLIGSVAKEYPQWDLRLLDLDSLTSVSAQQCLSLPWDKQGNALAHRQGEWFEQALALMVARPQERPVYRQNGVYVVLGGAGGLGEVWTRFMMERYQANVVWIGRRKYDAAMEKKINGLTGPGRAPLYISADATDFDALRQARETVLAMYPAIHGVVHSAIVLHDQSIARMEEPQFRASLSAKVDVSVNMDRVFGEQELDFMLFFSSIVSFFKSPGQSNYSAGCTFKDSFAHRLQQQRPYPVKIMNWGYWGNVGVVADQSHNEMMRLMGIGSIEPDEAMASLQGLVSSDMGQVALIKTLTSEATAALNLAETITNYPRTVATIPPRGHGNAPGDPASGLEAELPPPEMTELVTEILAASLKSLGLFSKGIYRITDLLLDKQPAPYYKRWLSSSVRYLQQQNVLGDDLTFHYEVRTLADLWAEWEAKSPVWATNPNMQAQFALFAACLKALPDVLSGKQTATDVMFPNSSMQLVEASYRGNSLADHFNKVLGETLITCIEDQLRADEGRKIRILEIGAGTGGTTAKLLPMLQPYPVAEYCYTDVSKAFLMYAEKHYRPRLPGLTTAIFDVSKPLATQSLAAADHYDFAIAANVLHATPDIRETLRNAKAVLKNQGVLLLNEISTWSLFNHLTFGLLEGWWLHQDSAVRLPGSPGLAPAKWREILAEEGFESIVFPAEETHRFGQQIIAAVSNGWVRQCVAKNSPSQASAGFKQADAKTRDMAATKHTQTVNGTSPAAGLTEQMSDDSIRQVVIEKLSEALQMDTAMIRNGAPFADYGVDSIIGVNLVRTINEALHIELETISLFDYSTVDQLTQYIVKNWQPEITGYLAQAQGTSLQPGIPTLPPIDLETSSTHRFTSRDLPAEVGDESNSHNMSMDAIAIVGMSGRFAESESLDEFWQNLQQGKDLVNKVSRWSETDCVMSEPVGRGYCSRGSFIDSIDRFDPTFFGISSQEAIYMDPQQRLLLEESWKALEDAGYAGRSVHEKQCGVYVGCGSSNYDRLLVGEPPPQAWWGNAQAVAPARIAYYLNFQGPAIAVDTACSSSLVAIHLACQGLWSRETEMALAGGVYVQATPGFHKVANRAGMLSPDGKCYSFDARANGFVPGEGVGVVVLKRLRDALQDGDHIHGVIAASGINQNGRSNGLTSPNARAQERLERSVYDRFKINPETIQVVEAHGTGTILGDSIECGAISRAFREYTDKKQFCAIGSVKTNVGHGATAAGVTGVLKLLLSMKHRQIPPSLHFEKGNPGIDFESGPFYVNTSLKEWTVEDNQTRRAAISSFGFSGTNAHLVIEEGPARERIALESPGYVVVLSARTSEQLKQQVRNLVAEVKSTPNLSMNDLSFTLFVGRMHLNHRLSCLARNQEELIHLLEQWQESGATSRIYTSEIQEGKVREQVSLKRFGNHCIQECRQNISAAGYLEHLETIADLFIQGYSLDFQALFARDSRRIPLPTYPFAKERYWIETMGVAAPVVSAATTMAKPPIMPDPQSSNLTQQSDGAIFTGAGGEILARLQSDLLQMVTQLLKLDAADISADRVLLDLGFDSVSLATFASEINNRYQLDITPVLFFDYYSVGEIAVHLSTERKSEIAQFYRSSAVSAEAVTPPAMEPAERTELVESRHQPAFEVPKICDPAVLNRAAESLASGQDFSREGRFINMPIAIVGMSGVMPQSEDLEEFWDNLKNGKDMVTVIPPDRWRWEDYYGDPLKEANKSNSKWGGFMKEIDKFDPRFFAISPSEARMMDPQQRIFLEQVWRAIEDSGHKVSDLSGTKTGLFVGVASNEYIDVLRSLETVLDGYTVSGNSHAVLANRVSYLLNLRGPSAPIDTACSSSLVALHRAIESIHTGSSDAAIVGGVQVMLSPAAYISFGIAGMLSSDGKCKTFDRRANGYVRGEGAGVIIIKPLSAAEADGDHIYAVIKATSENHGGRVPTLTAPNSAAQFALLIEAYEKAYIDPATIGYIECHGTGTNLGDPIEIQALGKAFAELYKRHNKSSATTPHCGLGSVKTSIGHLETAAGIAGVLKVLLAIKHKQIPANVHFEEINPYINLKGTPFYIADKLTPWEALTGKDGAPIPRRAGVSSFGFGGANAHVVMEEYIPAERPFPAQKQEPQLIVLSAKDEKQLKAYVQSMHACIERGGVNLSDCAYTLQVGRDEMAERLALVVSSTDDLKQKLAEILQGGDGPEDCYRNNIRNQEGIAQRVGGNGVHALIDQKELSKLAELWVSGTRIDWRLLHKPYVPRRISIPTYPFARERCWVPTPEEKITEQPKVASESKEIKAGLQSLVPVWSPAHRETSQGNVLAESTIVLLLGGDEARLEWLRKFYPNSQRLELDPFSSADMLQEKLGNCRFEQLLWIAPEEKFSAAELTIAQQEEGVVTVFRMIKALLQLGHGDKKLEWTLVTIRTQGIIEGEPIQPAHAGIVGLIGSLAKEYPQWDLRLLDLDSLALVSAQECLSLPWDKQGNALAHRRGEWFEQGLEPIAVQPQGPPVYRQNGVYVVVGGAGGIGEVWTRFMMENYQANVVWIGRRKYDAAMEKKIDALTRPGRAPLYISADATDFAALQQARATVLEMYPAIHGVVHSAIVLHDQSIARMEESGFRAGLSAKVDISVNMDRVFGKLELDFMLFFSSIVSFFKSPGQSNYSAGCTFEDSFAHSLQQQRPYPVKVMNWGYWGSVGVAADEFHRKIMAQMGIGSIEPQEGMESLQALLSAQVSQTVLIKTLKNETAADFSLSKKAAVSSIAEGGGSPDQEYLAPRNAMEEQLVDIWAGVLNLAPEKIGVNHSFFELGGQSLLATQMLSKIRSQLGVDLALMSLFEYTSVAQFAHLIAEAETNAIPPIRPVDRSTFNRLPLSFAQERVWFFDQLEPGSARYNVPVAVTIAGELDINQLERAFNLIVARHENLRTVFPSREGQAQQLILDMLNFQLERIDLSADKTRTERDKRAREICLADAATPFDLARGPLLRSKVIKLAEHEHIVMLNMHHIISDGWSLGVLIKELGLIMEALRQDRLPELAPLSIQYVDYSVWQRTWLEEGGVLKQQLAYWQKKLAGVPESLSLPTDFPRPSVQSFAGATQAFALDAKLTGQLKGLAEYQSGTLFMILVAALKVLLYRYSGQQDISIGTLIANRQYGETEGLIGMFVNTLALRSQVEGEDTFSALLSQVRATCLEAYKHQDAPFEKVVEMLRTQRNAAINPTSQVMVILQNADMGASDQRFPHYPFASDISEFDLSVEFTESPEGLAGSIEYSTALFKPQTIARMAEHFMALCRAITATPTARIQDLEYIGESEKRRLLVDFNDTRAKYPDDKCIHELFAERVLIQPDHTAVVCGEQELTYRQLDDKSRDLAMYLQYLGVKADSIVGVCMERSLDMMVATMGAVQAGGAYLPLDPVGPDDRLAYMLQDSQAAVVLTQEKFKPKLRPLLTRKAKLIALDAQWPEISKYVAALKAKSIDLLQEAKYHHLSYLMYTSGSTGRPKGVLVEHKALVNRISWMQQRYPLDQGDVVLQKAPSSVDVSVWELFWPMIAGASVVLAAPDRHKDVRYLEALINQAKVTTLHWVPSMLHTFLQDASVGCSGVKRIFCSGEALDLKAVYRYKSRFENASLHNLYGPTEATIDVTAYDCSQLDHPFVPIGTPINNTQIYILDQHNQPQPIGIPGELHVAGDGLARGYLNRPELTQEKFVANRFEPGGRMYKTGDLARWLDDGNIQHLGKNGEANYGGQIVEEVWLQEALLDDSYEKVTF